TLKILIIVYRELITVNRGFTYIGGVSYRKNIIRLLKVYIILIILTFSSVNILECYRFLRYLLLLYRKILIKGSSNKVSIDFNLIKASYKVSSIIIIIVLLVI
ncbi:hypothetical protein FPSE_11260, partial [Fusarium pseudograminearum CS3096]